MSWKQITVDWSDAEVVPAIRYPSTWIAGHGTEAVEVDYVFASVESINPGRETPGEIIDSLNNHNMGNIEQPARFTFEIACFPHGKGFDLLNKCSMGRRYFDMVLAPIDYFDTELLTDANIGKPTGAWNPVRQVYQACKVRRTNDRYSVGTKPVVTFSCTALRFGQSQSSTVAPAYVGNGIQDTTSSDATLGISSLQD